MITLLVTGFAVWLNYNMINEAWTIQLTDIQFSIVSRITAEYVRWTYLVSATLYLPFLFWAVITGVRISCVLIKRGLYNVRRPKYFGNVPADLSIDATKGKSVLDAIKSGTVTLYKPLEGRLATILTIIFGKKSGVIPPQERATIIAMSER